MKNIKLPADLNNNLSSKYFPVLVIDEKHEPGQYVAIHPLNDTAFVGRIVSVRDMRYADINEFVTCLSSGHSLELYKRNLLRRDKNVKTKKLNLLLIEKTESR